MPFLVISAFVNTPPHPKKLLFKNMTFSNMALSSQINLFSTEGFTYAYDLSLEFHNLVFRNITSSTSVNLLYLQHFLPTKVVVRDSFFENISSAGITIGSFLTHNELLKTRVLFENNRIDQFSSNSASFISAYESTILEINNCSFSNMHTRGQGAVVTAGEKLAEVTISDSVFQNNSAVDGSVFNIQSESMLK